MKLEFKDYTLVLPAGNSVQIKGAIHSGERVFLSGVSGSGKTTFIKSLLGLYPHREGFLFLDGQNISEHSPQKRKIGICFQGATCWDHLSVVENLKWALELTQTTAQYDLLDELRSVGLEGVENKFPTQLSGGERARVSILRSILCELRFYIFDEPFNGIDASTKKLVYKKIIHFLEKRGAGALFVSHDPEEITNMGTRTIHWEPDLKCINI